jgi:hypothetical protein
VVPKYLPKDSVKVESGVSTEPLVHFTARKEVSVGIGGSDYIEFQDY